MAALAGAGAEAPGDQLGPQGRHDPGGCAPAAQLDRVSQPGPGGHDHHQGDRNRRRQLVEAALGGTGDHGRQQRHLGQQQQRRHQPGGDADGQGPAGGRHSFDQPPVEGCTHQRSSPPVVR